MRMSQVDIHLQLAQETRAADEGHAKNIKLDPAVFIVITFVYRFAGAVGVAGLVNAPRT